MALRTSRIGRSGYGFPIATFSVLTDKHPAVSALHRQHPFAALRTLGICQIFMPEFAVAAPDF